MPILPVGYPLVRSPAVGVKMGVFVGFYAGVGGFRVDLVFRISCRRVCYVVN